MPKILKVVLIILLVVTAVAASAYAYIFRSQSVDLSVYLPESMALCGQNVGKEHPSLRVLDKWLKENQSGWHASPASYVPTYIYRSSEITINILKGAVVVNYYDGASWQQLVQVAGTTGLLGQCS